MSNKEINNKLFKINTNFLKNTPRIKNSSKFKINTTNKLKPTMICISKINNKYNPMLLKNYQSNKILNQLNINQRLFMEELKKRMIVKLGKGIWIVKLKKNNC